MPDAYRLQQCLQRAHAPTDKLVWTPDDRCFWQPAAFPVSEVYGASGLYGYRPDTVFNLDGRVLTALEFQKQQQSPGFFESFFQSALDIVHFVAAPLVSVPTLGIQSVPEKLAAKNPYSNLAYQVGQAAIIQQNAPLAAAVERRDGQVSLNIGQLLGGIGGAIGGISNPYTQQFGQVLQAGAQIAGAFQPQQVAAPVYGGVPAVMQQPQAQPVMSTLPQVGVAALAAAAVKPILQKVAAALSRRNISLSSAVALAKKLGKFFTSPEAIALYLGITVSELAQLITANAARKRRRMNPANGRALRRAARRIKSFHRMCQHTDLIKTRRRSSGARCGTCRRSPCTC